MQELDLICDEGMTSLKLKHRGPTDSTIKIESLRVRVSCSDCVAELEVESSSWSSFADLFLPIDDESSWSKAWVSNSGEWKLLIQRDEHGQHTIVSELDSLLDYHPWKLITRFDLSGDRLLDTAKSVRSFIGQT